MQARKVPSAHQSSFEAPAFALTGDGAAPQDEAELSREALSMLDHTTRQPLLDISDLCRMFEESASARLTSRKDAERDRDYVEGKQLKADELAEIERRLTACPRNRPARGVRFFKSATFESAHPGRFICMTIWQQHFSTVA